MNTYWMLYVGLWNFLVYFFWEQHQATQNKAENLASQLNLAVSAITRKKLDYWTGENDDWMNQTLNSHQLFDVNKFL